MVVESHMTLKTSLSHGKFLNESEFIFSKLYRIIQSEQDVAMFHFCQKKWFGEISTIASGFLSEYRLFWIKE
jgi:hypothetical protein